MKTPKRPLQIISMIIGIAVVALLSWSALPSTSSDPACTADPNLRVTVGGQLFSVPRAYLPNVFGPDGKEYARDVCQRPEDPPIEAEHLSITAGKSHMQESAFTRPIKGVQVQISHRALQQTAEEAYLAATRYLEQQGVRLESLPRKYGFLAYDSLAKGLHVYVGMPGTIVLTEDQPFVMKCSAPAAAVPAGLDQAWGGRLCNTPFYAYNRSIVVRYVFRDALYPVSSWPDLDATVRKLVGSMTVPNSSESP